MFARLAPHKSRANNNLWRIYASFNINTPVKNDINLHVFSFAHLKQITEKINSHISQAIFASDLNFSQSLLIILIARLSMKSIFIFVLIFIIFELINNAEGQGSPIASIGTYIIKYKERKRKEELRKQQRRNKTKQPTHHTTQIACDSFPFYTPCRYYYT